MNKIKIILIAAIFLSSCQKKLDRLVNDPNNPDLSAANVDLLLNGVQLNFSNFYTNIEDFGAQLTRQQQWYGPLYKNGYTASSYDGVWTTAYTGVIKNANQTIALAAKGKNYIQSGMARVMMAYTFGTLVDYFGSVPFSEAAKGIDVLNPKWTRVLQCMQVLLHFWIAPFQILIKRVQAVAPPMIFFMQGTKRSGED